MKPLGEPTANRLRNGAAVCTALLACLVIFYPGWYLPEHWFLVHGALILSALLGWYVEWRSGMLSLPLPAMPAEVRRRGWMAFGWARPLPLLANVLFCVASSVMSSRP